MIDTGTNIEITKTNKSRISDVDFDNIIFGKHYTDHMFVADYKDGVWSDCKIVPYDYLKLSPACTTLHYAQSIFEGLKAYRQAGNDNVLIFRPDKNFERLNRSADRMCIPELPKEIFFGGLTKLLQLDKDWVPTTEGSALYIRPFIFGTDEYIGVKPSQTYKFMIICCPVAAYYTEPVKVKIETEYTRAAAGGTGYAKAAGNYAASLKPAKLAMEQGYHQLLWTDAKEHKYIEESGTMNVMFVINDTIITHPLCDTILDGITRNSVLSIAKDLGYKVEERKPEVDEIISAVKDGRLQEAFGTGTAATITVIKTIGYNGIDYELPSVDNRPISTGVSNALDAIRRGEVEDRNEWIYKV